MSGSFFVSTNLIEGGLDSLGLCICASRAKHLGGEGVAEVTEAPEALVGDLALHAILACIDFLTLFFAEATPDTEWFAGFDGVLLALHHYWARSAHSLSLRDATFACLTTFAIWMVEGVGI